MNLGRYLFGKIPKYERLIYLLGNKYHSGMGMWGDLAPTDDMNSIRKIFIARTRGAYSMLRKHAPNAEIAYRELKTLLADPVAQEIELMSDAVINQRFK